MRNAIVLIVEGDTEKKSLPRFFSRFLQSRGVSGVAIQVENKKGTARAAYEAAARAEELINGPDSDGIIAVYSLLDLYRATIFPWEGMSVTQRCEWGKAEMERRFTDARFRHFFAVHEIEAWLLSDQKCLPQKLQQQFAALEANPEGVNDNDPPAKLLEAAYLKHYNRKYDKAIQGVQFFERLDPDLAYARCPHLRELLNDVLERVASEGYSVKPSPANVPPSANAMAGRRRTRKSSP